MRNGVNTSTNNAIEISSSSGLGLSIDYIGQISGAQSIYFGNNTIPLDDYEEGTFTATIEGGTAYVHQDGYYTKVGDIVHFFIRVQASSATGNSNRWQVHGLPFPSIDAAAYGGAFRNYGDNLSRSQFADLNFHIARNSTSIRAYDAQGTIYANSGGVQLTRQIILQGFYKTAS